MPFPDEREVHLPNGIILNGDPDGDGVQFTCATLDGWGSPAGTGGGQQRSGADGNSDPQQWLQARTLTLTGLIKAPSILARQQAEHRLAAALGLDLFDVTVVDAIPLLVRAKRSGAVSLPPGEETDVQQLWQAELECPDPRRYGVDLKSLTLQVPVVAGGLRFPIRFPIRFTGSSVSGDGVANNAGNYDSHPVLRIDGPCPATTVTNVTTGKYLTYNGTLAAGEYVLIDMARQIALLQGTASRTGLVSGTFWRLAPGDNAIGFRATSGTTGSVLIQWRDAYQ